MLGRLLHVIAAAVCILAASAEGQAGVRPDCATYDAEVAAGKVQPRRIALSIGNAANEGTPLINAVNDSMLIAVALQEHGWEVVHKGNLNRKQMVEALDQFAVRVRQLCPSDVLLFYFAGYGFEIDRVSYIFPIDLNEQGKTQAKTKEEQDSYLQGAVSLKAIMAVIESHKGPKVIVLDTCRDNPFEGTRGKLDEDLLAGVRLPDNTLYAYSAEPGDIALDSGVNPNYGPYAWALARAIREVEGTAEQIFRRVRLEVVAFTSKALSGTDKKQRPFVESSLSSDVYLGKVPARLALVDGLAQKAPTPKRHPAGPAQSRRIALVIANSAYETAGTLSNPGNDSKAISERLRKVGFEVVEKSDLKHADLEVALLEFGKLARRSDWAMIYFAGHGMEIGGRTYLLPTDVRLERDVDADDEAVRLDRMLERVERAEGIGLIILDACRNNPFERSMRRMGRRGRDAQTSVGLGRADIDQAGVLIAYSAKHGTVALDGEGNLSPFAEALIATIEQPGLEVGMLFRKVRDQVYAKTERQQEPYFYGTLPGREFFFVPPPK